MRQLVYSFQFSTADGQVYFFRGCKNILHEPWRFDVLADMTHLFTSVYRGMDENAPVYGTGLLRFRLADAPALFASMKCEGTSSYLQTLAARAAFLSVAWGALRSGYLQGIRLFYESRYENLVLAGIGENLNAGAGTPFLFVSGVHDKGFPWGDGELFWDVLLAIADRGGGYRRYGITDRILRECAKAPLTARDPVCDHLFADRAEAEASLDGDVKAIDKLQDRLLAEPSRALLVVLQGIDTSGKDGVVRGVFSACGPLGVAGTPFGRPSEEELGHDYLWRVHAAAPKKGMIGIFNRSHYEDVLVAKVRKLAPADVIEQRYAQINAFERHLSENGVRILKFMLHISKDEQRGERPPGRRS